MPEPPVTQQEMADDPIGTDVSTLDCTRVNSISSGEAFQRPLAKHPLRRQANFFETKPEVAAVPESIRR